MAVTEVYVDPSINADSGAGTIGDPYGDLEYAIEQTTFDTVNGTRVNVKDSATETLADGIDTAMDDTGTTAAWAPAAGHPMIIQGYTSTAGDGGIAVIDGDGSHGLMGGSAKTHCMFVDLDVRNCGAEVPIKGGASCAALRCKVRNSTTHGIQFTNYAAVVGNYVVNVGGYGIFIGSTGHHIAYNYIEDGANTMTPAAIYTFGGVASRNIIVIASGSSCMGINNDSSLVTQNSIYCLGSGTGAGIDAASASRLGSTLNNLIEGFNGVGGVGITGGGTGIIQAIGGNAVYDCTTPYSHGVPTGLDYEDNETLSASPFTDAENGDFSPVNTGNVKEGSLPNAWIN